MSWKAFGLATAILLTASALPAAIFMVPSDAVLYHRADAIVVGTVDHSVTQMTPTGRIETVTTINVKEWIKGAHGAADFSVDVHEPGGVLNGRITFIEAVPQFTDGEEVLLFLTKNLNDATMFATTDLVLGKFDFTTDSTGTQIVRRDARDIFGFDPNGQPHQEVDRDAAKFLDYLRGLANGGTTPPNYALPRGPSMALRTLSEPGDFRAITTAAFSATSYTMDMDKTGSGHGARWTLFPSAVSWYNVNLLSGATNGGLDTVKSAFASWNNDCGSDIAYQYAGQNASATNLLHGSPDGVDAFGFEQDLSWAGAAPFVCGSGGTIAIGGISSASGTHTYNGETFYTTQEADVEFNKGLANCTSFLGSGDFLSATVHEFGHTLGFRHSDQNRLDNGACSGTAGLECSSTAIMNSIVVSGLNGTLQPWDIDAARTVYAGGSCTVTTPGKNVRGDFDGDGKVDVLWHNSSTNANAMWLMNGTTFAGYTLPANTAGFVPGPIGDFDGDGHSDIFWHNPNTGENQIWFMNGQTVASVVTMPTTAVQWLPRGAGDFDGDGKFDIVWRDNAGNNAIWIMNGSSRTPYMLNSVNVGWNIAATGDFDGDGKYDLLWNNPSTGGTAVWEMNGPNVKNAFALLTVGSGWTLRGVGDFNGDGRHDVFWRDTSGNDAMWFMNGPNQTNVVVQSVSTSVQPVVFGDFNGDAHADIFWRNPSTGDNAVWLMNGASYIGAAAVTPVSDQNWQPVPIR